HPPFGSVRGHAASHRDRPRRSKGPRPLARSGTGRRLLQTKLCPSALSSLRSELRNKIEPFGLNSPAVSLGTALRILRARTQTGRSVREIVVDARQLLALPSPRAFECRPDIPAEPLVLFQTRLWPTADDPNIMVINE